MVKKNQKGLFTYYIFLKSFLLHHDMAKIQHTPANT